MFKTALGLFLIWKKLLSSLQVSLKTEATNFKFDLNCLQNVKMSKSYKLQDFVSEKKKKHFSSCLLFIFFLKWYFRKVPCFFFVVYFSFLQPHLPLVPPSQISSFSFLTQS